MPVYEYLCQRCRGTFELLRPMNHSQEPGECPDCESPGDRILSVFAAFTGVESNNLQSMPGMGGCGCSAGGGCACGQAH